MNDAKELIQRLKDARTWKEAAVNISDVVKVLEELSVNNSVESYSDSAELRRLKSKVDRLTESNKQLMAENKKLKGVK